MYMKLRYHAPFVILDGVCIKFALFYDRDAHRKNDFKWKFVILRINFSMKTELSYTKRKQKKSANYLS